MLGAGSAGTGICSLLLRAMVDAGAPEAEARSRFYLVDRDGKYLGFLPPGTDGDHIAEAIRAYLARP